MESGIPEGGALTVTLTLRNIAYITQLEEPYFIHPSSRKKQFLPAQQ